MEKRALAVLVCALTGALLVACGPSQTGLDLQATDPTPRVSVTPTTEAPTPSATPTPPGTWEVVIRGTVYDASIGPEERVAGAWVSYDHSSYYPEVRGSGAKRTVTDQNGEYAFTLLVHDTDALVFMVDAQGFERYSQRFTGVDLHPAGLHRIDFGLTPLIAPAVTP